MSVRVMISWTWRWDLGGAECVVEITVVSPEFGLLLKRKLRDVCIE